MPPLSEQQRLGRAKNALLSMFEQRLSVPKIYLDAGWGADKIDVLAVDRDGVGDIYVAIVVDVFDAAEHVIEFVEKLHSIPAHFKYLAIVGENIAGVSTESDAKLIVEASKSPVWYADDGVGRIGHIRIDFEGEHPRITMPISAERFRSTKHLTELADSFVSQHTADFEVRT